MFPGRREGVLVLTALPEGRDEALVVELWLLPAVSQPRSRDCWPGDQEPMCAVLRAPSGMLAVLLQEGFPSSSLPWGCTEKESTEFSSGAEGKQPPCSLHVKPQCSSVLILSTSSILHLFQRMKPAGSENARAAS